MRMRSEAVGLGWLMVHSLYEHNEYGGSMCVCVCVCVSVLLANSPLIPFARKDMYMYISSILICSLWLLRRAFWCRLIPLFSSPLPFIFFISCSCSSLSLPVCVLLTFQDECNCSSL